MCSTDCVEAAFPGKKTSFPLGATSVAGRRMSERRVGDAPCIPASRRICESTSLAPRLTCRYQTTFPTGDCMGAHTLPAGDELEGVTPVKITELERVVPKRYVAHTCICPSLCHACRVNLTALPRPLLVCLENTGTSGGEKCCAGKQHGACLSTTPYREREIHSRPRRLAEGADEAECSLCSH